MKEERNKHDRAIREGDDGPEFVLPSERAIRRLICTNNAMGFLLEKEHGNNKDIAIVRMMQLILNGCSLHKKDEGEYFLSYCKIMGRPFRVFDKTIKEVFFDFLLIVCEGELFECQYTDILKGTEEKEYLRKENIIELFEEINDFVRKNFAENKQKKDLILVLLKQLTELKSNFIIRSRNINCIIDFANRLNDSEKEEFIGNYYTLVKKLLGISSDTSKSLWFDKLMIERKENNDILSIPEEVWESLYLENVWVYQDAYKKLSDRINDEYIRGKGYFSHGSRKVSEKELLEFGKYVNRYIGGYQFKDYISMMMQYELYQGGELTEEGNVLVAGTVLFYKYILSEFERELSQSQPREEEYIIDSCNYIATYMGFIMDAETYIVMESNAEYDDWENSLIDRYNRLLKEDMAEKGIDKTNKKEYIILGSSEKNRAGENFQDSSIQQTINSYFGRGIKYSSGWFLDHKRKIFVWELGSDAEHPVYVYSSRKRSDSNDELSWMNRIRCVMQFYGILNKNVFNRSNNGFFHELIAAGKKLLIHSRYKAHSHTKDDIKNIQFDHVNNYEKYKQYYKSDLITLLADLNVSTHYRKSLSVDYYLGEISVKPRKWGSPISIFTDSSGFDIINSNIQDPIHVVVHFDSIIEGDSPLEEDDEILCLDCTNAEREVYLLVYSLIINAATENRGLVKNGNVEVWLSKSADGNLRISNIVGENCDCNDEMVLNEALKYPPAEEKQGISLWSMSRFVKKLNASMIEEEITRMESVEDEIERQKRLKSLKLCIQRMLSSEFSTKVEWRKNNQYAYFTICIPILYEKYKKMFKEVQYEKNCSC